MKLNEILTKYGGEVIQRPSIDNQHTFEYKGYKATFDLNDDDVYIITYDPPLLRKIERMYGRCTRKTQCKEYATRAIDLAQSAETQASGQAAQSGSAALDQPGGPLDRSNG